MQFTIESPDQPYGITDTVGVASHLSGKTYLSLNIGMSDGTRRQVATALSESAAIELRDALTQIIGDRPVSRELYEAVQNVRDEYRDAAFRNGRSLIETNDALNAMREERNDLRNDVERAWSAFHVAMAEYDNARDRIEAARNALS